MRAAERLFHESVYTKVRFPKQTKTKNKGIIGVVYPKTVTTQPKGDGGVIMMVKPFLLHHHQQVAEKLL